MPWITRVKKQKPHECALPKLSGVVKWGFTSGPGWLADPGDEWACSRCAKVWQVVEQVVAPPGWKGNIKKLKSTILQWKLVNKEWR